jgi:hypothetical protein
VSGVRKQQPESQVSRVIVQWSFCATQLICCALLLLLLLQLGQWLQRLIYVDNPDLGYVKGNQEIPAGAAFELEVEVLSVVGATASSS